MPTSDAITQVLAQLSQDWRLLAVFWHVYALAFITALVLKWRPNKRYAGVILILPLLSVVLMSWLSANPFTTVVLSVVLLVALFIISRVPTEVVSLATAPVVLAGATLLAFGLVYPHFLGNVSFVTYFYAAPVGIVPCPTLSVIVGLSLILRSLGSRSWSLVIGVPALLYGFIGALYLGVTIDWALSAGAVVMISNSWWPLVKRNRENVVA